MAAHNIEPAYTPT